MAEEFDHDQRELAQLWKRARKDGCMPPWQQAKVFGLKEAWEEMHGDKTYGQLKWIAERVYVQGHPKRHPIIITTNNWNYTSFCEADKDWIRANCVEELVDTPVWQAAT